MLRAKNLSKHFVKLPFSFLSSKIRLKGWLYKPQTCRHDQQKLPCVIMTHGFSLLMIHGLEPLAIALAKNGFVTCIYDHRGFGLSEGIALEINPFQQAKDLACAIDAISTLSYVDTRRIGLWGSSLSAGHALVVAAIDTRVRCLVAQTPFVDGKRAFLSRFSLIKQQLRFLTLVERDQAIRLKLKKPQYVPIIKTPKARGNPIFPQLQAYHFFSKLSGWSNKVTLQSMNFMRFYQPGYFLSGLKTPMLYIICEEDEIICPDLQHQAYQRAVGIKRLIQLKGGHFFPYFREKENLTKSEVMALSWFKEYLH